MSSDRRQRLVLRVAGLLVAFGVSGDIALGLGALAVFCWPESRTEYPALHVRLFRNPRLSSAATAISLNFFARAGVYFVMSFYLRNGRGYSPLRAGLLTTPVAIGQLAAASRRVSLVGRFGAKVVLPGGLLLVTGRARAGRGVTH
jgi:MFS transporter, DHA2 family, multidrug resistance protein